MAGPTSKSTSDIALDPLARRVIRLSSVFQLLFGLLFWLPVFYVYQRDSGLSDPQIFGIQSIYYVAFCLLEIPTGLFADRLDYRASVRLGALTLSVANLIPVLAPDYPGFLVHFLGVALARSLVSGAFSAYLYDFLHARGAEAHYQAAEGRARGYSLVGRVACLPVAGLLLAWQPALPYLLSAAGTLIAAVLALRLPAIPAADTTGDASVRPQTVRLVGAALRYLRGSPRLLLLMVQGVAMFTLVRIVQVNLFQPVLAAKQVPVPLFGVIMAVTTVCEIAGAFRSGWVRRWLPHRAAVSVLTLVMGATLAVIAPSGVAGTVLALCVFSAASGISFPIQRQLLNEAIVGTRVRATLLSIESIIDRAVCAGLALLLGGYLMRGQLAELLVHAAIATTVLIAVVACLLSIVDRRRREAP